MYLCAWGHVNLPIIILEDTSSTFQIEETITLLKTKSLDKNIKENLSPKERKAS